MTGVQTCALPISEAWAAAGLDDRDSGHWPGGGLHLFEMGLALMIWMRVYSYKYTAYVVVATLWAIALSKTVGL